MVDLLWKGDMLQTTRVCPGKISNPNCEEFSVGSSAGASFFCIQKNIKTNLTKMAFNN